MEHKTLEEYISAIQNISETEEKAIWLKADLLLEARGAYKGAGFSEAMAEAMRCSARYIQEMIKVAKTFPPEECFLVLPFTIHRICARTDNPIYWLHRANDEQLSQRQLEEEIRASKDTGDLDEKCQKAGERIARSIQEFREKYKESKVLELELERLRLVLREDNHAQKT